MPLPPAASNILAKGADKIKRTAGPPALCHVLDSPARSNTSDKRLMQVWEPLKIKRSTHPRLRRAAFWAWPSAAEVPGMGQLTKQGLRDVKLKSSVQSRSWRLARPGLTMGSSWTWQERNLLCCLGWLLLAIIRLQSCIGKSWL